MDVDYASEIEHYPVWVVESDKGILGELIMVFDNEQASISNIAIDPEFQGLDIGSELMRLAESQAREKDFSELHFATHVLLEENVALYRHLGWEETGREDVRIFMKKKI